MPAPLTRKEDILQAESEIRQRLGHLPLDFAALTAVFNIYRAATAIRNRVEREVLSDYGLSWGGFTILFVLWIWGPMEAARLARECGLAKGTLTGMVGTLKVRQLVERIRMPSDRRRVEISLTERGQQMIERVFPEFNRVETELVGSLEADEAEALSGLLRRVIRGTEKGLPPEGDAQPESPTS